MSAVVPPLAAAPWPSIGPRITRVRTFLTAPQGMPHLVVRVETDVDGLYGLGDGSDPQRTTAVRRVVDDYLGPMLIGRDVTDIEDLHRLMLNSGYWRGGSIGGNAIGAIDVALWDLAGKIAGRPTWALLGGRARAFAAAYTHIDGRTPEEVADGVARAVERGFRFVRVQLAVPDSDTYGTHVTDAAQERARRERSERWNPHRYLETVPPALARVRELVGDSVELLHDAHERLPVALAREFAHRVSDARLFFLEDVLAPEDAVHLGSIRAAGPTPIAIGELFGSVHEFLPLLTAGTIDYARIRIPTLGGLTAVRKLVAAAELHGVRIAPHGPGDVTPIGQAANLALDITAPNFGVQEAATATEATLEVYPGAPVPRDGALHVADAPGLGVDFDERAASRYPVTEPLDHDRWAMLRGIDGSVQRP